MTCLLAILGLKLFFNTFLLTVLYLGTFSRAVSMYIQPCRICVHSVALDLTLFFTVSGRMIQHHLASVNCLNLKARGVVTDWTIFCQVSIDPLRVGFDIFFKNTKIWKKKLTIFFWGDWWLQQCILKLISYSLKQVETDWVFYYF